MFILKIISFPKINLSKGRTKILYVFKRKKGVERTFKQTSHTNHVEID